DVNSGRDKNGRRCWASSSVAPESAERTGYHDPVDESQTLNMPVTRTTDVTITKAASVALTSTPDTDA
ncbi:hypothetical protein HAX54_053225, partial [Datura stramonium]|nr:hypothetical protein [Datura stramonium]